MRIVFMGSGELAVPSLRRLLDNDAVEVVAAVTQPDRPRGRNRKVGACPAKIFAEERSVPILTPEKIGDPESLDALRACKPDLIVVAAYGQYIPQSVLTIAPHGGINVHPSLLPRYRGAAPIQWAIANGENQTGVTILYVSKELDAGDIILQEPAAIRPDDTTTTINPRLAEQGAELLQCAIGLVLEGKVNRVPQEGSQASMAPRLSKDDGRIDWRMAAKEVRNRVRGFQPWPCCFCEAPKGSSYMLRVYVADVSDASGIPGEVLNVTGDGPIVATGDAALRLVEVQPAGKRRMSGRDFLNGHSVRPGDMWG